jgi:tetratricopeptide (TPR) repeat protein
MRNTKKTIVIASSFAAVALFSVIAFIFWTVVPQLQGREYLKKAAIAYTPSVIVDNKFIFEPYTSAQGLIRYLLVGALLQKVGDGSISTPDLLLDKAMEELEAYVTRFPIYYDYFVILGKAYEAQAELKKDPSLLTTAEGYYKKALEVAPGRQDAIYAYAINLLSQGRTDEAIAMLRQSIARNPGVMEGHYELGQALVVGTRGSYNEALSEFELALDHGVDLNPPLTLQIYQKFFYYYYHAGDLTRLNVSVKRLATLDASQKEQFLNVSAYIETNHSIPIINIKE